MYGGLFKNLRAKFVKYNNTISGLTAKNLQDAVDEVATGFGLITESVLDTETISLPAGTGEIKIFIKDESIFLNAYIYGTDIEIITGIGDVNVGSDIASNLCLYDDAGTIKIKNNLGATKNISYMFIYV
jgi:hypothetical protein